MRRNCWSENTRAYTRVSKACTRFLSGAYCLHWSLFGAADKADGNPWQLSAGVGRFRVAAWWKRVPASNLSEVTFEAGQPSVVLRVTSDNSRGGRNPKGKRWIGQGLRCRSTKGGGEGGGGRGGWNVAVHRTPLSIR